MATGESISSLTKDDVRVLLLEGIGDSAADLFADAGYNNVARVPEALEKSALRAAVRGVHLPASARTRSTSTARDAAAFQCSTRPFPTRAAWQSS